MSYSRQVEPSEPSPRRVELRDGTFIIDPELLGELLDVPASRIPILMGEGVIANVCERGIEDSEGEFRLTFFYRGRRARLSTDLTGRIIRGSVTNLGDRPLPGVLHRSDARSIDSRSDRRPA
jgi:hypothetical protein